MKQVTSGEAQALVLAIAARDGWECHYCHHLLTLRTPDRGEGDTPATIDHKTPLGRGGTWELGNLVLACERCNGLKGNNPYCMHNGKAGWLAPPHEPLQRR